MNIRSDRASGRARRRARLAIAVSAAAALVGWIFIARPVVRRTVEELSRRPLSRWASHLIEKASHVRGDLIIVRLSLLLLLVALAVWGLLNAGRVRRVIRRYFEEKGSPIDLAVFRIVLFAALFLTADPVTIDRYSRLPRALLLPPAGFGFVLRVLPITPELADPATLVLRIACVLALIGLFTQLTALVAALVAIYVLGIPQCYGQVDHYHYLVWFALILAFSRCGDALSVDAAWRRYRRGENTHLPSTIYARPIRWVWLLMGVIYFFPGIWKLWISGPDWLFGNALISHMWAKWHQARWVPAVRVDHSGWLARVAGLGAIAFELSFLPLVIHRRTRPLAAIAGLAFHNLTNLLMGISFLGLQAAYISFLPVSRLVQRFSDRRQPRSEREPDAPASRLRAVDFVGGLLLCANVFMGAMLIQHAWPIACFPTFAWTERGYSTDLEFVAVSAAESAITIDTWPLTRDLGVERWGPLVNQARRSSSSLAALARLVASRAPEARDAIRVVVYRVTWSTDPDRRSEGPVRREFVATVLLFERQME